MGILTHEESYSQWCNLPCDLLNKISKQYVDPQLLTDFQRRLRAVCTSWRSAISLSCRRQLRHPLQVPNPFSDEPSSYNAAHIFQLFETTYYLIGPLPNNDTSEEQKGWLVRVKENKPNSWRLLNPFFGVDNLFHSKPLIRSEVNNLLDYQVREIGTSYIVADETAPSHESKQFEHYRRVKPFRKVLTLPNHSNLHDDAAADSFTCTALALHLFGWLAIWKVGDSNWTKLKIQSGDNTHNRSLLIATQDFQCDSFDDIASHKGKFYAIERESGNVYVIDPITSINTSFIGGIAFNATIIPKPFKTPSDVEIHIPVSFLVECRGQLHYVRDRRSECAMSVSVLNDEYCSWESVDSVEMTDHVVFQLIEGAFSVPACELNSHLNQTDSGGWICSCRKYFSDYCFAIPSHCEGLEVLDGMVYPLYCRCFEKCIFLKPEADGTPCGTKKPFEDLLEYGYTSIFFPPPPWLEWSCPARGNAPVTLANLPLDRPGSHLTSSSDQHCVTSHKHGIVAIATLDSELEDI